MNVVFVGIKISMDQDSNQKNPTISPLICRTNTGRLGQGNTICICNTVSVVLHFTILITMLSLIVEVAQLSKDSRANKTMADKWKTNHMCLLYILKQYYTLCYTLFLNYLKKYIYIIIILFVGVIRASRHRWTNKPTEDNRR